MRQWRVRVTCLVLLSALLLEFSKGTNFFQPTYDILLTSANVSVKNIESSSAVLKNLLDDMQTGKGPAGTLLKSEELSASMLQIADNLSITTSNLNRLGLWGILWSHKPPRTNEPVRLPAPKNQFPP